MLNEEEDSVSEVDEEERERTFYGEEIYAAMRKNIF